MAVARNWLDGEYAVKNGVNYEWKEGEETTIKYPTFQGISYAMVYTNINDSFRISRKLTENGKKWTESRFLSAFFVENFIFLSGFPPYFCFFFDTNAENGHFR